MGVQNILSGVHRYARYLAMGMPIIYMSWGGGGVAKNGSVKFPMTPEVNTFLRNYISIGQKLTMLFKQTPNVTIDLVQQ